MQIYEFQKMMEDLYIKSDNERGIEATFKWLSDELQELKEALNQYTNRDKDKVPDISKAYDLITFLLIHSFTANL